MNKQEKAALLAQIAPPVPTQVLADPEKKTAETTTRTSNGTAQRKLRRAETVPSSGTGRTVAFCMDDEDLRVLDEISLFLHMKGVKPNASLTIRALLREASKDQQLVERARMLSELDGRRRRSLKREAQVTL